MNLSGVLVVIPARMKSTRLPGKPLIPISGVPMVIRTARRVAQVMPREAIIVATDSSDVGHECVRHDFRWEMTAPHHPTGTDRVAEVAERNPCDLIINVQGDEPVLEPDDLTTFLRAATSEPQVVHVSHCKATRSEMSDPKYVKLVHSNDRVLYMSRAGVPATKQGLPSDGVRQVGLYSFPPTDLRLFAAQSSKSPVEACEDIEAIRFLELGIELRTVELSRRSMSIDRESDVAAVETLLRTGWPQKFDPEN